MNVLGKYPQKKFPFPKKFVSLKKESNIITVLQSYQIERHIKKDKEPKKLKLNKHIYLHPDFEKLWDKIKFKTTYKVDYSSEELIINSVKAINGMDKIQPVKVSYREDVIGIERKGITTTNTKNNEIKLEYNGLLPDILAYIQKETELTRASIVRILTSIDRLEEFTVNPQKFMDQVTALIKVELHKLMIDGIKYEKLTVGETEWVMELFKEEELKQFFEDSLPVQHSVYDQIIYDSDTERKFAEALDKREDIKLFVKVPAFFKIETPIGTYNPEWAIVKHDDETLYID